MPWVAAFETVQRPKILGAEIGAEYRFKPDFALRKGCCSVMKSFYPANILIPQNADMTKWSVVACDQFTSEPNYWEETKKLAGSAPSTLNLIFPEIYLSDNPEKRIADINQKMEEYKGIFKEYKNSFVYVRRTLANGKIRHGLIGEIDLEDYRFEKGSSSNIRATEGTVLERIPPRVKIRENAPLEFPHIMVLIDDPEKTVIEPLESLYSKFEKLYDFELMQNGGKIEGYRLKEDYNNVIENALERLSDKSVFENKYKVEDKPIITFAVGDGNHSLATAKTCWENIKKNLTPEEQKTHPARFALVELVNLHDDSLEFEPIHRVMFDVDADDVYNSLLKFYPETDSADGKQITCIFNGHETVVRLKDDKNNLAVGTLQDFIDDYLKSHSGRVDYIHGAEVVRKLSENDNSIGFLLPAMGKSELFKTVILNGALPRKTFSMGEACDKRYYLEGKKIR